ncbi:PEP-CTERM sorting domain-containing protein [Pontiellaceae bacterium B12219]|nr:PEP-CTERM sorting domain-containing protein [Pontiellaceae bacterium B12219]
MKKYILITAFFAAGLTTHAGPFDPSWAGDDGTAYAEWNSWSHFSQGSASLADDFYAIDQNGSFYDFTGETRPDLLSYSAAKDSDFAGNSWLQLGATDDLSFWMPTFNGFETTEVVIQLSYWDDYPNTGWEDWRAEFSLLPQLSDASAGNIVVSESLGIDHNTDSGLITEAWGITVSGSTDGFFADFTVDQNSVDNWTLVEAVTIDTLSYDAIPEPASVISLIFGGVILTFTRRRLRR